MTDEMPRNLTALWVLSIHMETMILYRIQIVVIEILAKELSHM